MYKQNQSNIFKLKNIFFLILYVLFTQACQFKQKKITTNDIEELKKIEVSTQILVRCNFFNWQGQEIRSYPGQYCIPIKSGELILFDGEHLKKLDRFNREVWSFKTLLHHQLKITEDQSKIYYLSSVYKQIKGRKVRFDQLNIIDLDGKKLIEKLLVFDWRTVHESRLIVNDWTADGFQNLTKEYSHYNTAYEIMDKTFNNKAMLKGFLIYDNVLKKVSVLDESLKSLVYQFGLPDRSAHDVSFLNNDEIFYYANVRSDLIQHSGIVKYNIKNMDRKVIYGDYNINIFNNLFRGSVQVLPNKKFYLIGHSPEGAQPTIELVNNNGDLLKKIKINKPIGFLQDACVNDYSDFLKNNIGN